MILLRRTASDGCLVISTTVDDYTVFAVRCNGIWKLCFGLTREVRVTLGDSDADADAYAWADTLTGHGAFKTVRVIRPAVKQLVSFIESKGQDWQIVTDYRRARFYSRYVPKDKIRIVH